MSGSMAMGINNDGWIVGFAFKEVSGGEVTHAVCWTPDGTIIDLGKGLNASSTALGINNSGFISGWTGTGTQDYSVVVWTR